MKIYYCHPHLTLVISKLHEYLDIEEIKAPRRMKRASIFDFLEKSATRRRIKKCQLRQILTFLRFFEPTPSKVGPIASQTS